MTWTPFHYWMRFWCWLCYRAYMALPGAYRWGDGYRRFSMWLLGYAGAYAHSNKDDFHMCSFFYRSREEQSAAWDRHLDLTSTQPKD